MSEVVDAAETVEPTSVEVPGFIVNLIGRLVAENEALRAGLIPADSVLVHDDEDVVAPV